MIPDSRLTSSGVATFTSTDSTTALLPELELAIRAVNSRMRVTSAATSAPRSTDNRHVGKPVLGVEVGNPAKASPDSPIRATGTINRPRIQPIPDRKYES